MRQRIKPHPAVALILQHLRSEARTFDAVGAVGEKKRCYMETEGDGEMTEGSFHIQPKVDASYGGADWLRGELVRTFLSVFNHIQPARFMAPSH